MARLIGNSKISCAVFISGRGTNFKSIFNYTNKRKSKIILKLVISNKKDSHVFKFARKNKIKIKIVNFKIKNKAEKEIISYLKENNIKLICLAGFMKILSKYFIKSFKYKILNIHPSLLPKYKGLNTHERAIKNKEKFSGCTVHYVSPKLDSGKIIIQKKIRILKKDTPKSLAKRILIEENKLYPKALQKIALKI